MSNKEFEFELTEVARLAKIRMASDELSDYQEKLQRVVELIKQVNEIDVDDIEPLNHPLDITQRLRCDVVTETNQRELFQQSAPQVIAGLYLVPKVIEGE